MKKKLRLALLIDAWFPFHGGAQEHVRSILKRLSKECNFTIYHASSACIVDRALWSIFVIPKVVLEHRKENFDLIHAHAYIAGLPGKILSLILNIPVIYTVHGSSILDLKKMIDKDPSLNIRVPSWKYFLEKWLLTGIRYDSEISVSQHFLSHKNTNKKIYVIPNGVDVGEFDKVRVNKQKQFTIISIGRDDPVKGIDYLEKAMKIIKKKHPEIRLKRITGGIYKRMDLVRAYKSSHLFVLPSLAEGQPLTLLEAWAAKLPVVVTAVGDNSLMVKEEENGYLVPPADNQALAHAITKAYNNSNLDHLGEAGYNLVKSKYFWEKAAKATLEVYKEAISGT